MDGHRRDLDTHPPAEIVHRIHDRYLHEIVEGLGLCPFARRSREQGRVHRPLWWVGRAQPGARECAAHLADLVRAHDDAEIVLLTFIVPDTHAWDAVHPFEAFAREIRDVHETMDVAKFYMVSFHPRLGEPIIGNARTITRDNLVPLLRRSPDPVIQCVRADVLDAVRTQAQGHAATRLERSLTAMDPEIRALIENSVSADSELSADIAQHNFGAVGQGAGRERLEALIGDILADRARLYGAQ